MSSSNPDPEAGYRTPPRKPNTLSLNASTADLSSFIQSLRDFDPKRIVQKHIDLPGKKMHDKVAFTLDNVFTPDECKALVNATESVGYGVALVNVGLGRQKLMSDIRNNTRCMIDHKEVADIIFQRIRPFLPSRFGKSSVVSLNERLRFLKYTKGQLFAPHFDGSYMRPEPTPPHSLCERSYVTVQLYLNDGEGKDFEGGSTAFLNPRCDDGSLTHCHPRTGRVLVFEHHLYHQGSEVKSGTKYCLRTDVMYQPDDGSDGVSSSEQQQQEEEIAASVIGLAINKEDDTKQGM